jgi:hypothetical protein
MEPVHFYHVYADSSWEEPVREHFKALEVSGFRGKRYVGLVGSKENRERARRELPYFEVVAEELEGFEQVTIRALHSWAKTADPQTPVLYAHTKGSSFSKDEPFAQRWRHAMVHGTVMTWPRAVKALKNHDAVGCWWQVDDKDPRQGMFAGNYWWANAGYLAALPGVSDESRFHAEGWIALGCPKVLDLDPNVLDTYGLKWNFFTKGFDLRCKPCPLN